MSSGNHKVITRLITFSLVHRTQGIPFHFREKLELGNSMSTCKRYSLNVSPGILFWAEHWAN